ncbi:protein mono-ADP-ribosyltransferase PARP14 isoform X2 [Lampris incognitus]|uniref:protein mono-ADP-ribosyltransferase PARP14 isoform X2 n=1 Tax=Lampris incognitus TaxID=2546036 RepID=UPI0024B4F368|nr:protein mono-ADP-ribosyltransferase PARP14 isoform X2 [Lampris incognitus]
MDPGAFKYPLFFEAPSLDAGKMKKTESYFKVRRKSGGGDCGGLVRLTDKVYQISFRDETDQQRVLEKSEHVVEFEDGPVTLKVHLTAPFVSPDLGSTPAIKSQSSSHDSPLPSSDVEYELHLDTYLLRYLKECPRAERELERELSSLACSAQLHPEEERALVRVSAQTTPNKDGAERWKARVDELFEQIKKRYFCLYEVDPHRVKALLRSCRSIQATDEVRIYSQIGVAVVVGEHAHVQAWLKNILDSQVKSQGSEVSQRQTVTRRLGEAKLNLLWKEIEQGLREFIPGVKATQGDGGKLVLEGYVGDVRKAGEWVAENEGLVFEKVVSEVSLFLLVFLKKAYGVFGTLATLLEVGGKVEIEIGDSELRLFTLVHEKLDHTEKALWSKFKDVKIDIPNCSVVPSDLKLKLESKAKKGGYRAMVRFGSDSKVYLVGHTDEVDELNEEIIQFILDHSSVENYVLLPFPEVANHLPELLKLHDFDHSDVTFHSVMTSSRPMICLSGSSRQVTQVRNRLGPFLDSLVRDTITINQPGALRYFQSPAGRDVVQTIGISHHCLIQLQDQHHVTEENRPPIVGFSQGSATIASYQLQSGLQVLVRHGDITKEHVDALVNAANENLDHCGGVAAALSKAGGPQVQKESTVLVRQTGKIPTGDVVMTTGGKLYCKALLHAVGPVWGGGVGGRERALLEKVVLSTLKLAKTLECQSLAMPCISSGIFGVPVKVCAEAIVTAIREFVRQGQSLNKVILIDNRVEVLQAMQEACDRLIEGMCTGRSATGASGVQGVSGTANLNQLRRPATGAAGNCVRLEIVQGTIEKQQVDALVSPIVGNDPVSTRVGKILSDVVGSQLVAGFHSGVKRAMLPGENVLVEGLSGKLSCNRVFFLNLIHWDNNQEGTAVQVLRQGVRSILSFCLHRRLSSVAFPVLGTGAVLRFPHRVVAKVLLEEFHSYEHNVAGQTPFLVRIIIHPNDKESAKEFECAQGALQLRGFTNNLHPDYGSFYRHISSSPDEVTATLGGVKLQLVSGDITHEKTDVIVNTTAFQTIQSGVSKAILTAAGPSVQAELRQVGIPKDSMCTTGPGALGCKEIIHATFWCDSQRISEICGKILKQCESKGYRSVAFPAVNTGVAGMDFQRAGKAMLDGMAAAVRNLKPAFLSLIRIVIMQTPIFQAFRLELENRFGKTAPCLTLREKAKQMLEKIKVCASSHIQSLKYLSSTPSGLTLHSWEPYPVVLCVVGCGSDTSEAIRRELEENLQQQLTEREVDGKDVSRLDVMELEAVQVKVRALGVSLQQVRGPRGERPAEGGGGAEVMYVLRGLKEDVLSVNELVDKALKRSLHSDLQKKEEAMVALQVQWSMQDAHGAWQEVSLHGNYLLEQAYQQKDVCVDINRVDGTKVKVNMKKKEAIDCQTGLTYMLKRDQTATLELPKHWEPMAEETFMKVLLQPNSREYEAVAQDFLKTAVQYKIRRIERVQNTHLWQAYALCRQRIWDKNGEADVGEKMLYHGSTAEACYCIERTKFDRSYTGKHGSLYGRGVYFAVNASYSATNYSPPDQSGLRRLYVARVLTGRYILGNAAMKSPPPRSTSDPSDCFDSLVDSQTPKMFVIFHDHQAYPEYLISFV